MITDVSLDPVGGDAWRLTWTSDLPLDAQGQGPVCFVYRDGKLATHGPTTSIVVVAAAGESPVFEVLDDEHALPTIGLPPDVHLAWSASPDVARYRVEQLVGADWVPRQTLSAAGKAYFNWRSGTLADGEVHQFRVIPVGHDGNEGATTSFAMLVVRVPDPPVVTMSYDKAAALLTFDVAD